MLGIGVPDRHALPHITPKKCADRKLRFPPARAGSFCHPRRAFRITGSDAGPCPNPDLALSRREGLGAKAHEWLGDAKIAATRDIKLLCQR